MSRSFIGYTDQFQSTTDKLRARRKENVEAWKAYLDDAATTGKAVSPEELERYRMNLTNGDSYFMSALPSREMIKDIAHRTNQRVTSTILAEATGNIEQTKKAEDAGASIIPIDADEEGSRTAINKALGEEAGNTWWAQFGRNWQNYQDKKVNQQAGDFMSQPRFQTILNPEEIDIHYATTSPRVRLALKQAVSDRLATERKKSLTNTMNTLSVFTDPNFVHMNDAALLSQVKATFAANGVDPDQAEMNMALNVLRQRRGVALTSDNTQRVRALHGDLLSANSIVRQMLEGPSGANMNEQTLLEAINTMGSKHGIRFQNMEELNKAMGEDLISLTQKIRAGIEYDRQIKSVQANAQSMAESIVKRSAEGLAMAAKSNKQVKENDPIYMAANALANEGYVFVETPSSVIQTAIDIQKQLGTNDYTQIKNAVIEKLKPRRGTEIAAQMSAEHLITNGVGPKPGESALLYFNDFENNFNTLETDFFQWLEGQMPDKYVNGQWKPEIQGGIVRLRQRLETRVRQLRSMVSSVNKANFAEYGANQTIFHNGRSMSMDEFINDRLVNADNRLRAFDQRLAQTRPQGRPPPMPLPFEADLRGQGGAQGNTQNPASSFGVSP